MRSPLKLPLSLAVKDLTIEFRRRYEFLSILMFSLSSILVCSFAWRGILELDPTVVSAALWIVVFFSNILIMTTSFAREVDTGTIDGLKSLPCPPYVILLGKVIYTTVIMLIVTSVVFLSSLVFLNLNVAALPSLVLIFFIGMLDLSLLGSMISALVMYSEGRTLLLAYLFFPVSVPVLIPGTLATEKVISGLDLASIFPELRLLLAFMLSVSAVSVYLFRNVFVE